MCFVCMTVLLRMRLMADSLPCSVEPPTDAFKSQRLQQVKYNITPLGISAMEVRSCVNANVWECA